MEPNEAILSTLTQPEHSVRDSVQESGSVSRSRSRRKKSRTKRRFKKKTKARDSERPEAASSPTSPTSDREQESEKSPTAAEEVPQASEAAGDEAARWPPTSTQRSDQNKAAEEASGARDKEVIVSHADNAEPAPSLVEAGTRKSSVHFGKMQRHEFSVATSIAELTVRSPTFCASLFILISLVVVLLLFGLFMPARRKLANHCSSADCKRAAEELQSLMDIDVEPCSNFYHHVCNKWLAQHADGEDLARATLSGGLENVQRLLQEENRDMDTNVHSATFQLRAAFVPCLTFLNTPADIANLAHTARSVVDVLLSKSVNEALQRVVTLSLLRGISTLFHISVVRHNGENVALYISQAVPLTEKLKETTGSTTLANFLEEMLNAVSQTLPEGIRGDVSSLVLRLIEFDKGAYIVEPEQMHTTIAAISDRLSVLSGGGDIVELVNSLLPGTWKLSIDSSVFCSGLHSIEATIGSFRSQYKLGLLYIFVHVLVEIGQFYYAKQLIHKKPTDAKNTCLEASRDVVSPRLWSAAVGTLASRSGTAERVADMFYSVRRLSSLLFADMDEEALLRVQLMHHNVSSHLLFNDSDSVNVSADFGIAYLPLKTLEASRRFAQPPYIEYVLQNRYAITSDTTYVGMLNAVVFPSALRRPPFVYAGQVPVEFDMATAGTMLTRRVLQAGLPRSGDTENITRFLHCAQQLMQRPLLTPSQTLNLFAWTRSLKVAHLVMIDHYEWLQNATKSEYDRNLAHRTFFRRFCLSTCNGSDGSDSRLRCLLPILTMPEFYAAFSCASPEVESLQRCIY